MMDHPVPTDKELVQKALDNRECFALIVERYEQPLIRYLRRIGGDSEAVKDIIQEIFIKLYIHLNDYDADLSFSAWLYRIAHNEAVNYWKKARLRPSAVVNEEDLELFEMLPDTIDIIKDAQYGERAEAVRKSLSELTEPYREIFVLRYLEEKSYDEISDILEIPPGTVATYLSRGKSRLKKLLENNIQLR